MCFFIAFYRSQFTTLQLNGFVGLCVSIIQSIRPSTEPSESLVRKTDHGTVQETAPHAAHAQMVNEIDFQVVACFFVWLLETRHCSAILYVCNVASRESGDK